MYQWQKWRDSISGGLSQPADDSQSMATIAFGSIIWLPYSQGSFLLSHLARYLPILHDQTGY